MKCIDKEMNVIAYNNNINPVGGNTISQMIDLQREAWTILYDKHIYKITVIYDFYHK